MTAPAYGGPCENPFSGWAGALVDGQLSRAWFVAEADVPEATPCPGSALFHSGIKFAAAPGSSCFSLQAGMSEEDMQELRATVLTKE